MWLNNGSVNELVNTFFEQITYDKDRKFDKIIILVHLNLHTFLSEITKSNNDYYKTNKRVNIKNDTIACRSHVQCTYGNKTMSKT